MKLTICDNHIHNFMQLWGQPFLSYDFETLLANLFMYKNNQAAWIKFSYSLTM